MSNLRSKTIKLASTLPKGSQERRALLRVLAFVNPAQILWNKLVRDGIVVRNKGAGSRGLWLDIRTTNIDRIEALMKQVGWKATGPNWDWPHRFTLTGGYAATLDKGSRGVTVLNMKGPKLDMDTKTPPKLTKDLRAIMRLGWRGNGVIAESDAYNVVGVRNLGKVPAFMKKLVGYGYLVKEGDNYKVTGKGLNVP